MSLWENFPYTNLHELNLAWLIDMVNNLKKGTVTSVNGKTGDVTLYEEASVQFPNTELPIWNIVRNANGKRVGIAFHDDGTAYILYDGFQRQIYDEQNPPDYPVKSVNGQTGNIILYQGAVMQLPALTDEQLTSWKIFRSLNGTNRGLQFNDDGTVSIIEGNTTDKVFSNNHPQFEGDLDILFPEIEDADNHAYWIGRYFNNDYHGFKIYEDGHVSIMLDDNTERPLYIQGINDPSDFTNPSDIIVEMKTELSSGTEWGIIRKCSNVDVGILFKFNSLTLEWDAYIKKDNTLTKLLTINDIPSGTGVVSINTKSGVVTLYGNEILLGQGLAETVSQAISSNRNTDTSMQNGLAIVCDGLTHPTIKNGQIIYVKNNSDLTEGFYMANTDILAYGVIDQTNTYEMTNILNSKILPLNPPPVRGTCRYAPID